MISHDTCYDISHDDLAWHVIEIVRRGPNSLREIEETIANTGMAVRADIRLVVDILERSGVIEYLSAVGLYRIRARI